MLHLVTGTISATQYMGDTKRWSDMRLVEADTLDEAQLKFERYFEAFSKEYSVSYSTQDVQATAVVL
jgi:hypothetical protein